MKWKQFQVNNTNNLELVTHCPRFIVMHIRKEHKYCKVSDIKSKSLYKRAKNRLFGLKVQKSVVIVRPSSLFFKRTSVKTISGLYIVLKAAALEAAT